MDQDRQRVLRLQVHVAIWADKDPALMSIERNSVVLERELFRRCNPPDLGLRDHRARTDKVGTMTGHWNSDLAACEVDAKWNGLGV
jgi:hypothetical protein